MHDSIFFDTKSIETESLTVHFISDKKFLPNVLAYDIETDELKIGEGKILMISLVGKNFRKVLTWKKSPKKKKVEDAARANL